MALGPRLMRTGSQSVWGCVRKACEGQFPPHSMYVLGGAKEGGAAPLCCSPHCAMEPSEGESFQKNPL